MIHTFQFHHPQASLTIIPKIHFPKSTTHCKSIITCAKSKPIFRSQRSRKTLIQFARFAASNLHHVFPAPFNSVIREIGFSGTGDGGSSGGGWNGFRWGGFNGGGGGGGGGRKRRVNKMSQFWALGLLCVLGVIISGDLKKLRNDVLVLGGMCVSMFVVLVRNGCVSEWVLGFCCGGLIVGLLVNKKDDFNKFVKRFKANRLARYIKIK